MFDLTPYLKTATAERSFEPIEWTQLVPALEKLGFTVYRSTKTDWHIEVNEWKIWRVQIGWQSARLLEGRYCEHIAYKGYTEGLEQAINRLYSEAILNKLNVFKFRVECLTDVNTFLTALFAVPDVKIGYVVAPLILWDGGLIKVETSLSLDEFVDLLRNIVDFHVPLRTLDMETR